MEIVKCGIYKDVAEDMYLKKYKAMGYKVVKPKKEKVIKTKPVVEGEQAE